MNVWIFVINALFTPVVEPLGVMMADVAPPAVAQAATAEAPVMVAASITAEPRYHGIERLLVELEAHAQ